MFRSLLCSLALASLSFATAACGTTEAAPATAKAQPSSTGDAQATCVEMMTKNRTCTDDFIPALVDARARHDKPPGIAEAVKADRDAVIAEAKKEWAEDGKDEAIARTCQQMVESGEDMTGEIASAKDCLAKPDCASYVACVTPLFEKRFTK